MTWFQKRERIPILGDCVVVIKVNDHGYYTKFTAIVCHVETDGSTVNLGCFAEDGNCFPCCSVEYLGHKKGKSIGWTWQEKP